MTALRRTHAFCRFLWNQRVKGFAPPSDEPWMDSESIERFKHELSRASRYVEFGSGGTTILADRAGIPTISVESDRFYARAVATRLLGSNVEQVIVDIGLTGPWGKPVRSTPTKGRRYAEAPYHKGTPFPDLILVDGRYRVACALTSARLSARLGKSALMMFDDYADRPHYHCVVEFIGKPEMVGRMALFKIGDVEVSLSDLQNFFSDSR